MASDKKRKKKRKKGKKSKEVIKVVPVRGSIIDDGRGETPLEPEASGPGQLWAQNACWVYRVESHQCLPMQPSYGGFAPNPMAYVCTVQSVVAAPAALTRRPGLQPQRC